MSDYMSSSALVAELLQVQLTRLLIGFVFADICSSGTTAGVACAKSADSNSCPILTTGLACTANGESSMKLCSMTLDCMHENIHNTRPDAQTSSLLFLWINITQWGLTMCCEPVNKALRHIVRAHKTATFTAIFSCLLLSAYCIHPTKAY